MKICLYCKETNVRGNSTICLVCKPLYNVSQQKICSKCLLLKNWKDFFAHKLALFKVSSLCKICASIKNHKSSQEAECFFRKMYQSCQQSARLRALKSRELNEDFTMTLEQLKAKWIKQNQKCAYSGLKMNLGSHCHFKASPERLDNNKSYTDENVVLIIAELNIGQKKQFSETFLFEMIVPDYNPHPQLKKINKLLPLNPVSRVLTTKPLVTKIHESKGLLYKCITCSSFKDINAYHHSRGKPDRTCIECIKVNKLRSTHSIEGKLRRMLDSAKCKTKRRNCVKNRAQTQMLLTMEEMRIQLIKQEGKCFYSGKNLSFDGTQKFHISLERINTLIGYNKNNIVFICEELNSGDRSASTALHNQEKRGHGGWTKQKFAEFRVRVQNQSIM